VGRSAGEELGHKGSKVNWAPKLRIHKKKRGAGERLPISSRSDRPVADSMFIEVQGPVETIVGISSPGKPIR